MTIRMLLGAVLGGIAIFAGGYYHSSAAPDFRATK